MTVDTTTYFVTNPMTICKIQAFSLDFSKMIIFDVQEVRELLFAVADILLIGHFYLRAIAFTFIICCFPREVSLQVGISF